MGALSAGTSKVRLTNSPHHVFHGLGNYPARRIIVPPWGTITGDYETACREFGFKPWAGTNAKKGPRAEPRDIGDVLLHETAISWLRREEESTRPLRPWEETPEELSRRIQQCVSHINREFDVRGLCMEFPGRLDALVKTTHGGRLPK